MNLRQATPDDWSLVRSIRLEALQSDPSVFGSNYARESGYDEATWRRWSAHPDKAVFLLFDGEAVVGLTGVVTMSPDPGRADGQGPTAVCVASYLRPAYRGRKLSRWFYEARIAWARAHGYHRIVTAHRLSNIASRQANQHFGFTEIQRVPHRWSDGVDEPEVVYELPLEPLRKISCVPGLNSGVE